MDPITCMVCAAKILDDNNFSDIADNMDQKLSVLVRRQVAQPPEYRVFHHLFDQVITGKYACPSCGAKGTMHQDMDSESFMFTCKKCKAHINLKLEAKLMSG